MNITTDEATRQLITGMAESLQTTAQQAFNLYVQGVRIEALGDLMSILLVCGLAAYTGIKSFKYFEKEEPTPRHDTRDSISNSVIVALLTAGILVIPVAIAVTSLQKVIIPEYYVMKDVLETASQVVK